MEEELDISALSPIAKDTTSRTPFKTVNDLEARLQVSGPPTEMGCGWLCIVSGNGAFVCPGRGSRAKKHSGSRGSLSPHHAGSSKEVPSAHKPALLLYLGKLNAPGDQELAEENLNLQIRLSVGEAPTPSNQRAAFSTPDNSLVQAAGRGRAQGCIPHDPEACSRVYRGKQKRASAAHCTGRAWREEFRGLHTEPDDSLRLRRGRVLAALRRAQFLR